MADDVSLTLTKSEALVLFDLPADLRDQTALKLRDEADRVVLWNLCALLERSLVEIFSPAYNDLLRQARTQLLARED